METVNVVIDGIAVKCNQGTTILDAARQAGVEIPTLCHSPDLTPTGVCRICVVEVEGAPRLVASCHTPAVEGMVIHTKTPKVTAARKANVELLLTAHTGTCVTDINARNCGLHKLAAELEVGPPRFQVERPRFYEVEEISPYVQRDLSKCILCRRCVRACSEIARKDVYSIGYRGFRSKVVVDYDAPLDKEVCKDCGICIRYCPTGALAEPASAEQKMKGVG
jgi:NADP-reducing hydrogenase subunit HndD